MELPDWVKIAVDGKIDGTNMVADYDLMRGVEAHTKLPWETLVPDGTVTVRVHPSVFAADAAVEARADLASEAARSSSYYEELGLRLRQQGALLG